MCGEHDEFYRLKNHQILVLCELIYIPIIVLSNVLVIVSITLVRRFHTPDNVLLVALASVDLTVGGVVIPMTTFKYSIYTHSFLVDNDSFCVTYYVFVFSIYLSSLSVLTLVVIFKSISINCPFWYCKHVDNKVAKKVSIFTILFQFIIIIPINFKSVKYVPEGTKSHHVFYHRDIHCSVRNIPHMFIFDILYFYGSAQLLLSCCLCIQIAIKAKKMSIRRKATIKTNLVICLLFLFIILWLPTMMQTHFVSGGWTPHFCAHWGLFSAQLRNFNSFMNALAYGVFNKHQRHAFHYLMTTPPWRWKGLRDYMRLRDVKEALRQHIKTLNYSTKVFSFKEPFMTVPPPTPQNRSNSLDSEKDTSLITESTIADTYQCIEPMDSAMIRKQGNVTRSSNRGSVSMSRYQASHESQPGKCST